MNILAAIFPLRNFLDQNQVENCLVDRLRSLFPFARTGLLRGNADQCFRSLLFQAALSYVTIGKRVSFYTPMPFQTIPSLVHSLIPSSIATANLHLIQFHYFPTLTEVHKHLINANCDVIIIDGYLEYPLLKGEDFFPIISACALLKDTYEHLKEKFPKRNVILLCSCTCTQLPIDDVKHRTLFDLDIDIEMGENGDYHAKVRLLTDKNGSCTVNFCINRNEIVPHFLTIER